MKSEISYFLPYNCLVLAVEEVLVEFTCNCSVVSIFLKLRITYSKAINLLKAILAAEI
jgi:hypothetical protein